MDGYSKMPSACRWCGMPERDHRAWVCNMPYGAPHDWLIKLRMQIRRGDRTRWIPMDDERILWPKWYER